MPAWLVMATLLISTNQEAEANNLKLAQIWMYFSYVSIYEKYEFQHTFAFVLWVVSRKTQILWNFCILKMSSSLTWIAGTERRNIVWNLFSQIYNLVRENCICLEGLSQSGRQMPYFKIDCIILLLFGLTNNKYIYCILTNASLVGYGNFAYIH